jgi:hypothetical protein
VIKFLEQDGRRLMDRAQNCLAVVCELLEERKDRPSRLTVQTGRRLVKEKK